VKEGTVLPVGITMGNRLAKTVKVKVELFTNLGS